RPLAEVADLREAVVVNDLQGLARVVLVGTEVEQGTAIVPEVPASLHLLDAQRFGIEWNPATQVLRLWGLAVRQPVLHDRHRRADSPKLVETQFSDEVLGLFGLVLLAKLLQGHVPGLEHKAAV